MIRKIIRFIKDFRYSIAGTAVIFLVLILPSPDLGHETGFISRYGIDKLFHFITFFTLSIIQIHENRISSGSKNGKLNFWILVMWAITLACFTELYQELADNGRRGSFFDWVADVLGIMVANLLNNSTVKKFLPNRYNRY